MNDRKPQWTETASGPGIPVMEDRPPLDVDTIRTSIRQATEPVTVPIGLRIEDLTDRLRGHLGALLAEDLGDNDYELRCMRREAELLLRSRPADTAARTVRWEHVGILAASVKGLMRRREDARPAD